MMINYGSGSAEEWDSFFTILHENSHFIEGSSLKHLATAFGGVFSEANESAATGYITIQATDLDQAKKLVLLNPVHKNGGTVQLLAFE